MSDDEEKSVTAPEVAVDSEPVTDLSNRYVCFLDVAYITIMYRLEKMVDWLTWLEDFSRRIPVCRSSCLAVYSLSNRIPYLYIIPTSKTKINYEHAKTKMYMYCIYSQWCMHEIPRSLEGCESYIRGISYSNNCWRQSFGFMRIRYDRHGSCNIQVIHEKSKWKSNWSRCCISCLC